MKTIYRILVLFGLLAAGTACSEDSLSPEYEYNGPIPAIADGPSELKRFVMSCTRNMTIMFIIH